MIAIGHWYRLQSMQHYFECHHKWELITKIIIKKALLTHPNCSVSRTKKSERRTKIDTIMLDVTFHRLIGFVIHKRSVPPLTFLEYRSEAKYDVICNMLTVNLKFGHCYWWCMSCCAKQLHTDVCELVWDRDKIVSVLHHR